MMFYTLQQTIGFLWLQSVKWGLGVRKRVWEVPGPLSTAPSPRVVKHDGRLLPVGTSGQCPLHVLTGRSTTLRPVRRQLPADGGSNLDVSACALHIFLVGNEFTNSLKQKTEPSRGLNRWERRLSKGFSKWPFPPHFCLNLSLCLHILY